MLYIVECGFADPSQEAAWNDWYSGPKLKELLAVPDFLSAQRFRALDNHPAPYLNVTSIASTELFTNPDYRRGGGGGHRDLLPARVRRALRPAPAVPRS